VIEGAALSILALSCLFPVLAWNGFVVRVHCAQSCLAEVLGKRIVWLSEIFWSVGELTVLSEWTFVVVQVVLAQLSFVFLLQSIELALVSVEVVVVGLLSKVPHHFSRWVVEVPWSALCIHTFALVTRSLDW
jgi:hypothetical protein